MDYRIRKVALLVAATSFIFGYEGSTYATPPQVSTSGPYTVEDADGDGLATVSLSGSAVDPDGGNITWYIWRSPSGDIKYANSATANRVDVDFTVGAHQVAFWAKDSQSEWAGTYTTVTVIEGNVEPQPPLADAGGPYFAEDIDNSGSESIVLDGSYSTDPDGGEIKWYIWKIVGEITPLASTALSSITCDFPVGTHEIQLQVKDDEGAWSSLSKTTITVDPGNLPPIADPGGPYNVADTDGDGAEEVTLYGPISYDPDGGEIKWYIWKVVGETTPIASSASPNASCVFGVGTHNVQLQVKDDEGDWSVASQTTVTVRESAATDYNVLFIAVDDLRTEISAYNKKLVVKTPNLDKLANESMLFERAYCQQSVCSASRASLMAGARPDTTGVTKITQELRNEMPNAYTIGRIFRDHGYTSQSLGKIFHHYNEDDDHSWSQPAWKAQRQLHQDTASVRIDGKMPSVERGDDLGITDESYNDGQLKNKAIELLNDYSASGEKFFLAVGFNKPHLPFCAPAKYWDQYDRDNLYQARFSDWPTNMPEHAVSHWPELSQYWDTDEYVYNPTTNPNPSKMPNEKAKELVHGYYASVSYVDAMIGQVIDELDQLGLRKNTIIVLCGDHGWKLNDFGAWSKQTNLEIDNRVPLLIDVPGLDQGRTKALVELVDIYPTLTELCDLTYYGDYPLEGSSMVPVLMKPNTQWKPAAFSQYQRGIWDGEYNRSAMGYSIRSKNWRYTEWWLGNGIYHSCELYKHVAQDELLAGENVAEEHPDVVYDMFQLLHQQDEESVFIGQGWKTIQKQIEEKNFPHQFPPAPTQGNGSPKQK